MFLQKSVNATKEEACYFEISQAKPISVPKFDNPEGIVSL
jgi:hypothetical protein